MEEHEMDPRTASSNALSHAPRGMTLIEILVVIAIIGIVATVVAVGVVGYLRDAKVESTKTLLHTVGNAVTSYTITRKKLPKDLDDLVKAQYLKAKQTRDPWDMKLEYNPGSKINDFKLCSSGPDTSSGGDDDICLGEDED